MQRELVVLRVALRLVVQIRSCIVKFRVQLRLGHVRQRFQRIVREHVLCLVDDIPAVPPSRGGFNRRHAHIGRMIDARLRRTYATHTLRGAIERGTSAYI